MSSTSAEEVWAAAQLAPGEGIEDGVKRIDRLIKKDAEDAARWRRLVNASELAFPLATVVDDPENDKIMRYGRETLENLIDSFDEIPDSYVSKERKS